MSQCQVSGKRCQDGTQGKAGGPAPVSWVGHAQSCHQCPAQEPCPEPPLKASCLSPASPTSVMAPAWPCGLGCLVVILGTGAGMQAAQILRDFEFLRLPFHSALGTTEPQPQGHMASQGHTDTRSHPLTHVYTHGHTHVGTWSHIHKVTRMPFSYTGKHEKHIKVHTGSCRHPLYTQTRTEEHKNPGTHKHTRTQESKTNEETHEHRHVST